MLKDGKELFEEKTGSGAGWRYRCEAEYEIDFSNSAHRKYKDLGYLRVYESGLLEITGSPHGDRAADDKRWALEREYGIRFQLFKDFRGKLALPDRTPIKKAWIGHTYHSREILVDTNHGMVLASPKSWGVGAKPITYYSRHARPVGGIGFTVHVPNKERFASAVALLADTMALAQSWATVMNWHESLGPKHADLPYYQRHPYAAQARERVVDWIAKGKVPRLDPNKANDADVLALLAHSGPGLLRAITNDAHGVDYLYCSEVA